MVFDISRFALHDGPGIRTTVFLKGCPLRCLWCHNPESQSYNPEYSVDYEKCVGCLKSGNVCPFNVKLANDSDESKEEFLVELKAGSLVHNRKDISRADISECYFDAIKIIGYEANIKKILKEVLKDKDYYDSTGGGMTISGGEPMFQPEFVYELAKQAKKDGIHVSLDTSGYANPSHFKKVLPFIDVFLFDYKESDEKKHKDFTGVGLKPILEILDMLYKENANIILRCPLIPGYNDNDNHLKGIAELSNKYPNLKEINIMAYHDMGNYKSLKVGHELLMDKIPNATTAQKEEWLNKIKNYGIKREVSFG